MKELNWFAGLFTVQKITVPAIRVLLPLPLFGTWFYDIFSTKTSLKYFWDFLFLNKSVKIWKNSLLLCFVTSILFFGKHESGLAFVIRHRNYVFWLLFFILLKNVESILGLAEFSSNSCYRFSHQLAYQQTQ